LLEPELACMRNMISYHTRNCDAMFCP
jgi:hypothetical protein